MAEVRQLQALHYRVSISTPSARAHESIHARTLFLRPQAKWLIQFGGTSLSRTFSTPAGSLFRPPGWGLRSENGRLFGVGIGRIGKRGFEPIDGVRVIGGGVGLRGRCFMCAHALREHRDHLRRCGFE